MKRSGRAEARKAERMQSRHPGPAVPAAGILIRGHVDRAVRDERAPRVVRRFGRPPEPTVCERCGAVYASKTWRAGERTLRTPLPGIRWTVCPACRQVAEGEYFGRVLIRGAYPEVHESEIRARIWGVAARAASRQPERRIVSMDRTDEGLEVFTTSQKLAHRITRSLLKGYGGETEYHWTEPHGQLYAVWERNDPGSAGAARPRRRRSPRGGAAGFDLEVQARRLRPEPDWKDVIEEESVRFAERFPKVIRFHVTMSRNRRRGPGGDEAALVVNLPGRTLQVTRQALRMTDALRAAFRAAGRAGSGKRWVEKRRPRGRGTPSQGEPGSV